MAKIDENIKVMMLKGADGAGIKDIQKTSTSGLKDTYTITLSDGTASTFSVTNGKEVSSISKTGTRGLEDTYTIQFNDGTTSTFTVTNGKDGDGLQNLQVGGVNLIRSTINDFEHGDKVSFEKNQVDYFGKNDAVKAINKNNGERLGAWFEPKVAFIRKDAKTVGKKVLSFYAKGEGDIEVHCRYDNSENNGFIIKQFSMTAEYKRYVVKYNVLEEIEADDTFYIVTLSTTGVYIANIKLETGDIATDWEPAPEDLEDQYITYDITNKNKYSSALTYTNSMNVTGGMLSPSKQTFPDGYEFVDLLRVSYIVYTTEDSYKNDVDTGLVICIPSNIQKKTINGNVAYLWQSLDYALHTPQTVVGDKAIYTCLLKKK